MFLFSSLGLYFTWKLSCVWGIQPNNIPCILSCSGLTINPIFWEYPFSLFACAFSFVTTSVIAVYFDTVYYGVFRQYLSNNAYEATPSFPFSAVASVAAETFQNPLVFQLSTHFHCHHGFLLTLSLLL